MKQTWVRRLIWAAISICAAVSMGCAGSRPASFYTLSVLQGPVQAGHPSAAQADVTIAIGPVTIPDYLDRPEMVTRTAPNSLKVADFDRWGEPLQKGITRILVENLSLLLATDHITTFPNPIPIVTNYQVLVEVTQLDPTPGGKVLFGATWTLFNEGCEKVLSMNKSRITTDVDAPGFEGIAAAVSRSLEALSVQISDGIRPYMLSAPEGSKL